MNDLQISFDRFTNKHYFMLPAEICGSLLLPDNEGTGLTICHEQVQKLILLRHSILEMNAETTLLRIKQNRKRKFNFVFAGTVLTLAFVAVFVKDWIIEQFPFLLWPYYIVVIASGTIAFILIFFNYMTSGQDVDTLRNELALLEVRNRIEAEFLCK